tara:strand:- start:159 stop:734 length:576 start_codon:yes stop_codon:yes gene_type:complete
MLVKNIKEEIQASIDTKHQVLNDGKLLDQILDLAEKCTEVLKLGGKVIFCGNGGSFADAQHLSAEFTSRFMFDRPGLASIALGTNSSAMTAIGNDYGYEYVFARELQAIANPNDFLIAITTSGNSLNILKAIESAQDIKLPLVVFTGESNGKLQEDTTTLNIPSSNTARIQECHILIGHIVCGLVESEIFG